MSGICGIVRFDGAPIAAEMLDAMHTAMAHWGPHGIDTVTGEGFALTRFLQRQTLEDRFDAQPIRSGSRVLAAAARLSNRDALLRELQVAPSERDSTPDAALLYAAYERWGEAMVDRLDGDWHAAIWDSQNRKFFLARDHFGVTSLHYIQRPGYFAFASSIKALIALPDIDLRPDMLRMAQVLIGWMGSGDLTGYENFRSLPTGQTLSVTEGRLEIRRYWEPLKLPPLPNASDEEYVEQFVSLYQAAVRNCLRGEAKVGATLSGGLDSGSVVALAAPLLREEGRSLTAYTSVPLYDHAPGAGAHRTGNEWNDAHATAEMAGVTTHHPVDAANTSLLDGIRAFVEHQGSPGHAVGNYYWMAEIAQRASEEGVGLLLSGQYGNASISYSGTGNLWPMLARGDWAGLVRSLSLTEPSYPLAVKRQVIKPFLYYPPAWYAVRGPGSWQRRLRDTAINDALVGNLDLKARVRRTTDDVASRPRITPFSQAEFYEPGIGIAGGIWRELAASAGIMARDPTTNRSLIEFCVQAPGDLFRRKGMHRWLIRHAMAGRMPAQVLHYKKKGLQAVDAAYRAIQVQDEFHALLDRFAAHDLAAQCLDVERMRKVLHSLGQGVTEQKNRDTVSILCRGTGVGLFLLRF